MRNRKNLPVAALRAFEAAARHGRLTAAAEELSVTHGAISRHVTVLEALIGTQLFEGPRNRPQLTAEGRVFGAALTIAFDQMESALRIVGEGDDRVLDVACLSTFAMRWLIPRLHEFTDAYPHYNVRLATDDRPPRTPVDVQIMVLPSEAISTTDYLPLFQERLGVIVSPSVANGEPSGTRIPAPALPRLETRTRPHIWQEWTSLTGKTLQEGTAQLRIFDHYHLTIEAAINGLGVAIAPWHVVAGDIASGRLVAPHGFVESNYCYVLKVERPMRRKTEHFVEWLRGAVAAFPAPIS